jgi:hypothetical protein
MIHAMSNMQTQDPSVCMDNHLTVDRSVQPNDQESYAGRSVSPW